MEENSKEISSANNETKDSAQNAVDTTKSEMTNILSDDAIEKKVRFFTSYSNSGKTLYKRCMIIVSMKGITKQKYILDETIQLDTPYKLKIGQEKGQVEELNIDQFKKEFDEFMPIAIAEINEEINRETKEREEKERIEKILKSKNEKYYIKIIYYSAWHYDYDSVVYIFGNSKEEIFLKYKALFHQEIKNTIQGDFRDQGNRNSRGEIELIESVDDLNLHEVDEFQNESAYNGGHNCTKIYKEGEFLDFEYKDYGM